MPYESFDSSFTSDMTPEQMELFFAIYFLVFGLIMLAFAIVSYIFMGKGLSTIARRRGISKPWLAWVPVGNVWILGSISDQYRYVARGQVKNKRKLLVGFEILYMVMSVIYCVYAFDLVGESMALAFEMEQSRLPESHAMELLDSLAIFAGLSFVYVGCSIPYMVLEYMALYDIFRSCNPKTCVLFFLLSLLVGAPMPFLLYISRNKDLGMPPRVDELPPAPPAALPE